MALIIEFLSDPIISIIILPIITGVIASSIVNTWSNIKISKKIIKNSEIANNRLIGAIRPYFIQQIDIRHEIIEDVRNKLKRKYDVNEKLIYGNLEIRESLVAEISETQFLDEKNKIEIIEFIYRQFDKFRKEKNDEKERAYLNNILKEKDKITMYKYNQLKGSIVYLIIVGALFVTIVFGSSNEVNISNEWTSIVLAIIATLLSALLSLLSIVGKSSLGGKRSVSKYIFYYIKNRKLSKKK